MKNADRAFAQITEPMNTPEEMVDAGDKHIPAILSALQTTPAADIATTVTFWQTENQNLDASNKKVTACETALATARVEQATSARRWMGRAKGCVNAVTVFADGSKDVVAAFNMDVAERTASPRETMPEDLHGVFGPNTTAIAQWTTHKGNHGYIVQWATSTADPTTFSVPAYTSRGKFELAGQTPAALIYFRVAAFDERLPGRQTAYTAWVGVRVSL